MREILFRGQTRRKGERVWMDGRPVDSNWVYGGVLQGTGAFSVMYGCSDPNDIGGATIDKHVVYTDTLGQYTGLTDRNGKKIFEGDIVNVNTKPDSLEHGYKSNHLVIRFDEYHRFVASGRLEYPLCNHYEWEIIGNIHDNPELLKGGAE